MLPQEDTSFLRTSFIALGPTLAIANLKYLGNIIKSDSFIIVINLNLKNINF